MLGHIEEEHEEDTGRVRKLPFIARKSSKICSRQGNDFVLER